MSYDPNTLDPEQIRALPMRRDLPLNGLSELQVRAIGADPDEVEASRVSRNEWATQRSAEEHVEQETNIAAAALEAVQSGETSYGEAAEILGRAGHPEAQAALLEVWKAEENQYMPTAAEELADAIPYMDAAEYSKHFSKQQLAERESLARTVKEAKRVLSVAQVTELQEALAAFVKTTPGAQAIAPAAELTLVKNLKASGLLPTTSAERSEVIETAVRKTAIVDQTTESIRQQVEQEIRLRRKPGGSGMRDGLTSQADIDLANDIYREQRFKQLANAKQINTAEFAPGPTAEDESNAYVERFRAKSDKSTELHKAVGEIAERGKAAASGDRGVAMTEDRKRFQDAKARAEANAVEGGGPTEIRSGYGPHAMDRTPDSRPPGV